MFGVGQAAVAFSKAVVACAADMLFLCALSRLALLSQAAWRSKVRDIIGSQDGAWRGRCWARRRRLVVVARLVLAVFVVVFAVLVIVRVTGCARDSVCGRRSRDVLVVFETVYLQGRSGGRRGRQRPACGKVDGALGVVHCASVCLVHVVHNALRMGRPRQPPLAAKLGGIRSSATAGRGSAWNAGCEQQRVADVVV